VKRRRRVPVVVLSATSVQIADHLEAKRLIANLIDAARAACPYVPDTVAAPEGGGTLPVGVDLARAVKEIQGFQAVTGGLR
jgi:hypothetical protein